MPRAQSHYRQMRAVLTESRGGLTRVEVLVKPVNVEWSVRHRTFSDQYRMSDPPGTLAAAYRLLGAALLAEADRIEPPLS